MTSNELFYYFDYRAAFQGCREIWKVIEASILLCPKSAITRWSSFLERGCSSERNGAMQQKLLQSLLCVGLTLKIAASFQNRARSSPHVSSLPLHLIVNSSFDLKTGKAWLSPLSPQKFWPLHWAILSLTGLDWTLLSWTELLDSSQVELPKSIQAFATIRLKKLWVGLLVSTARSIETRAIEPEPEPVPAHASKALLLYLSHWLRDSSW